MKKITYETPTLEVVEIVVESGFATSNEQQNPSDWEDM